MLRLSPRAILATALLLLPPLTANAAKKPSKTADVAGNGRAEHTLLAAGDTASVPLDLSMGQPIAEVMINGRGPYRMFVDTGAGTTVLDLSLATELGLAKIGTTRIGDPANPEAIEAQVVRIDSLRIGGAVFTGVPAASWDRAGLRSGPDVPRGVVGFPVFHELLETFDFPNARMRLTRGHLPAADGRRVLGYRTEFEIPVVPIDVAGTTFEAHLDTGSGGFLSVPQKDSSKVRFAEPLREVGRGRTVNSTVVFRGATLDGAVRLGDVTWDRPIVLLNDVLPMANLGSRALRDLVVTLDASNERVSFVRTRESAPAASQTTQRVVNSGPPPGEKTAGVMLSPQANGRLKVVDTLPGSAASRADLKPGDLLLKINGDATSALPPEEARTRLHRSPVTLTLEREGRTFDVTLEF